MFHNCLPILSFPLCQNSHHNRLHHWKLLTLFYSTKIVIFVSIIFHRKFLFITTQKSNLVICQEMVLDLKRGYSPFDYPPCQNQVYARFSQRLQYRSFRHPDLWKVLFGTLFKSFHAAFPILLEDNGSKFSNPLSVEFDFENNWRIQVFYCASLVPFQKGERWK